MMNSTDKTQSDLFLITGATGNVGQHLVKELIQKGYRVRALTRTPKKADLPAETEVVKGDLTKPDTLAEIFSGVTGFHLITNNGENYKWLKTAPQIIDMAVQAGVKKVSVIWKGRQGPVEKAVKESALEWTILKPQEFMSNMLGWSKIIRNEGIVEEPFINRKTALIHEGDIALAAAAVLTESGHNRKEYTLTGPEVLTIREAAKIIGEVIKTNVQLKEISKEKAHIEMQKWGIDEDEINYILSWYQNTPPEGYTVVPTVEKISGHAPRTFRQWVIENETKFKSRKN